MKTIQQLSIFLENKLGRLNYIMEAVGEADIRIIAAMVADTSEYGILRLITSNPEKTYKVLKERNISVQLSEVIAIESDSKAGAFLDKLRHFSAEGIGIEYMYCFSEHQQAILVIRVRNLEKAKEVVEKHGLKTLSNEELTNL